ncbi:SRPBCC family protein [Paraoerskovia sediminicola]|nr:SRPBCC family protein [Paraoerskovia sediminicola]
MGTNEIVVTRVVDAPVAAVWRVLTDIEGAAQSMRSIEKIEILAGNAYEVGLRWRETRKMFGMSATEEMWVAEVTPGVSTRVDATSGSTGYSTTFTLEEVGPKTRVVVRFAAVQAEPSRGARLAQKVLGPVGSRATAKMLAKDLEDVEIAAAGRLHEMDDDA